MTRLKQVGECRECGRRERYKELEKHVRQDHNTEYPKYKIEIVEIDCPCCGREKVYDYNYCPQCGCELLEFKSENYDSLVEVVDEVILMGWSIDSKNIEIAWSPNKHSNTLDYNVTWYRTDDPDETRTHELPYCLSGFLEEEFLGELEDKTKRENHWNKISLETYLTELNKKN